jgi:predicted nucleic acid-binding protein
MPWWTICARRRRWCGAGIALDPRWQWLRALALDLHGVDFDSVVRLALQHRLTTDDASYLWLAPERNLPLATLDTQLDAAWKSIA